MKETNQINTATSFNVWAKYGTDVKLEENGAKLVLDDKGDVFILIARQNGRNHLYNKDMAELNNKYSDPTDPEFEKATLFAFTKHFIKGWQGITDKRGNPLEFNTENAFELLQALPDLLNEVVSFSFKRENYSLDLLGDTVKN